MRALEGQPLCSEQSDGSVELGVESVGQEGKVRRAINSQVVWSDEESEFCSRSEGGAYLDSSVFLWIISLFCARCFFLTVKRTRA